MALVDVRREANSVYHANLSALGKTMLSTFGVEGPAAYERRFVSRTDQSYQTSDDLIFGDCLHIAVLEPDRLPEAVVEAPSWAAKNGVKRGHWDEFCAEHPGKHVLTRDEMRMLREMVVAFREQAKSFMETPGEVELSVYWRDRRGILHKCRPDKLFVYPNRALIGDFKSAFDSSPPAFFWAVKRFHYWLSVPHYIEGVEEWLGVPVHFRFYVIGKKHPYKAEIYDLPAAQLREATQTRQRWLDKFAWCQSTGMWPDSLSQVGSAHRSEVPNANELAVW